MSASKKPDGLESELARRAREIESRVDAIKRPALAAPSTVSAEELAFLDAAIDLWRANERVRELDAETGALQRDRDYLSDSLRRFMRAGDVARLAEARRDSTMLAAREGGVK